jgi:hypothetical protein
MNNQLFDPFLLATDWQLAVLQDYRRFAIAAAGRRRGKTTLGVLRLWIGAETRPGTYLCVATRRDTLLACWDRFLAVMPFPCRINRENLCIHFDNGSRIYFVTEEAVLEGSCKGWQIDGVVVDEFFFCKQKAGLAMVLLPALSDNGGWALLTGSVGQARPATDRLQLLLRIAVMRAGFDLSSIGIYAYGS